MMKKTNRNIFPDKTWRSVSVVVCLALFCVPLMACSGGAGGGSDGNWLAGGGIGGTGIVIGEIAGFGSIIINDADYETEEAEVIFNGSSIGVGDSIVRSSLALGMVVRVEASYEPEGTSRADRIVFTSNVKGPVESITPVDSVVKILSMLGQSVVVDDQTRFKNTAFDQLAENNVLEISGWPDAAGSIRATFINQISDEPEPGTEISIKGIVKATNAARRTFLINRLVVDISETADPMPAIGQLVSVTGMLDDNGLLIATRLSVEDELGPGDADSVEIEGVVTQVLSSFEFVLGTTAVQTDDSTSYMGLEPDDIEQGVRLLVKGALTGGRVLADEVVARDKLNIRGQVASIIGTEIRLKGLDNLFISVSDLTRIFGDAGELGDIQSGQDVKVLGYAVPENRVEATQIKVKDDRKDRLKLQGPVTGINKPIVTVLGVDVDTNIIPDDGFQTDGDDDVSRIQFLDTVAAGDTVSVTGTLNGDFANWKEIELKTE